MGGGTVKYTLRVARIVISLAVFVVLTVGVMCSAFMLPAVGPWLAKIQLVRSLMYFSLTIFVVWLLVTLMFGRIYCSSVCPLGTLQDISAGPCVWGATPADVLTVTAVPTACCAM